MHTYILIPNGCIGIAYFLAVLGYCVADMEAKSPAFRIQLEIYLVYCRSHLLGKIRLFPFQQRLRQGKVLFTTTPGILKPYEQCTISFILNVL